MDPVRCGGQYGDTCAEGEYCDLSGGYAGDPAAPIIAVDAGVGMPPPPVTGVCRPIEVPCGGQYGNTCADNEYCDVATGIDFDPALPYPAYDGGMAPPIPPAYDAGVVPPIDPATGVCRPLPEQFCGGIYGDTCGEGEYCDITVTMDPPQERPYPAYDAGFAPPPEPFGVCRPIDPPDYCGPNGVICPDGYHCESNIMVDLLPPEPWDGGAPIQPPLGVRVPDEEPGRSDVTELVCGSNGHHLPERLRGRVHGRHRGLARPLPPSHRPRLRRLGGEHLHRQRVLLLRAGHLLRLRRCVGRLPAAPRGLHPRAEPRVRLQRPDVQQPV